MPITTKDNVITRSSLHRKLSPELPPNYVTKFRPGPSITIFDPVMFSIKFSVSPSASPPVFSGPKSNLDSGERRRIIGRVGPIATIERIRASAANQRIVTPHAVERVIAAKADEDIVAGAALPVIVSPWSVPTTFSKPPRDSSPGVAGAGQELADIDRRPMH